MKKNQHMLELAARGAHARLSDLIHEVEMLLALFPHLRDSFDKDELPIPFLLKRGAEKSRSVQAGEASAGVVKQTRNLSVAARRAISNAQKQRWAAHRAAKAVTKKG
ncbi:MAG: hypothetical protein ABL961_03955 [Vicinamibacterales bacterium]